MKSIRHLALLLCFGVLCPIAEAQTQGNLILSSNDLGTVEAFDVEIRLAGTSNDWVKHRLHDPNGIVTPISYVWTGLEANNYEVRSTIWLNGCPSEISQTITREVLPLLPTPPTPTIDATSDGKAPVDPVADCNNDPSCTVITTF